MKNEIKDLMDQKKKNDSKKNKVNGSNTSIKEKLIREANPILKQMNQAERSVMEEKKERLREHGIYNLRSIPSYISNIQSMSSNETLLKLKETRYDCDGQYSKSYKIPLVYFDMTEEEILESHTKWCNEHLDKLIEKKKAYLVTSKTTQIEKLKQEIKTLKKN